MLKRARGWHLAQDARGGWRRIVPSPRPLEIVEVPAIRALLDAGMIVIAAGGGGVPVVREGGRLVGVEAVVDKDLTSAILAKDLAADTLVLATDVEAVAIDYKKPGQKSLARITAADARAYLEAEEFPPGSMGPKVEAAVEFVGAGGKEAIITSIAKLAAALDGPVGTHIVP
jgi:carbamate kinase